MNKSLSIEISIPQQRLWLKAGTRTRLHYPVSTARNGPGELCGSECTPRGLHVIAEKIGGDCPMNTVFAGRVPTGEIYSADLRAQFPERDWILTRILWLSGAEPGVNCGGEVDSQSRYIYIHGTPDEEPMGEPRSHGCVRMRNADIVKLFEKIDVGTPVIICA